MSESGVNNYNVFYMYFKLLCVTRVVLIVKSCDMYDMVIRYITQEHSRVEYRRRFDLGKTNLFLTGGHLPRGLVSRDGVFRRFEFHTGSFIRKHRQITDRYGWRHNGDRNIISIRSAVERWHNNVDDDSSRAGRSSLT